MPREAQRKPGFEVPSRGLTMADFERLSEAPPESLNPEETAALAKANESLVAATESIAALGRGLRDQLQDATRAAWDSSLLARSIVEAPRIQMAENETITGVSAGIKEVAQLVAAMGQQIAAMGQIAGASLEELERVRVAVKEGQDAANRWAKVLTLLTIALVAMTFVLAVPIVADWISRR
jgi:hypothetical protein